MTLQDNTELNKGQSGAKRSSWSRLHFRDLALKIWQDNPDLEIEEAAKLFVRAVKKSPGYLESISIYIMANTKASLRPTPSAPPPPKPNKDELEKGATANLVARVAARVLMDYQMLDGKPARQSTFGAATHTGGFWALVGTKGKPREIIGEKLTEADLQKLFKKYKR